MLKYAKNKLIFIAVLLWAVIFMTACGSTANTVPSETTETPAKPLITVGFSQLGAESDWRTANTESMREAFSEENGYKLLLEDGQQKQANQIRAIRTFIQQEVDYIVLAPVTEEGWDTVLQEAKDAGIPVIIVDRMVKVSDEELFTCWIGSDFELEGKKAVRWLYNYLDKKGFPQDQVNIVNIQGTIGASAEIGRTKGLREGAEEHGWKILAEAPADFTETRGREIMTSFLRLYSDINVVYAENDNSALGAISAIEAAGRHVGTNLARGDIMVISFDGVKAEAMEDVISNRISCIAECNPLHGPRVRAVIEMLENGETPKKLSYVDEEVYVHDNTVQNVTVNNVDYPLEVVTQELLDDRGF